MLKALELVGFKSFADKTRFEFPDGITVVVGPNGSGKSNVVDAVKWVLGAQSAKALRGADMADVIFKGSAEGGRKPANSAEVVLVLDNSTRIFHSDSDEVQVCRRVFRSGEGEYAINGQPCRLKDVKDLFRGTGVGVDAYSLIEQGKVDKLLQSSNKERRGIFEEAAGISRFKAKKVEAERRLQRVDQNLVRLGDIVDEVGKRLQTLKGQATKAHRYRELTQQLTSKRWELGWVEYQLLKHQHAALKSQLQESVASRSELANRSEQLDAVAKSEKESLEQLQADLNAFQQAYIAAEREAISAETGYNAALSRSDELETERMLVSERLAALQERVHNSTEESERRRDELDRLELERDQAQQLFHELGQAHTEAMAELASYDVLIDEHVTSLSENANLIHDLKSKIVGYQFHIEQLQDSIDQWREQGANTQRELQAFEDEVAGVVADLERTRLHADLARAERADAESNLNKRRSELFERQEQLAAKHGKLLGVKERLAVLTQLEDQFAGDGRGGQQLLRLARSHQSEAGSTHQRGTASAWGSVRGLVADIVSSEMHLAPLIDVALGPTADAIVLDDGQIVDWVHQGSLAVDGRVTLLRLDRLPNRRTGEKIQLDGLRGVIGRADRLTNFAPEYEPLIRALLGTTWFVDSLTTALELSHFRGAGLRFVTAECQLVDSDGSITIGSLQAGLGLISRRTEMQIAREEIQHLEGELSAYAEETARFQQALLQDEKGLRDIEENERVANQSLSRVEAQGESIEHRRDAWTRRLSEISQQILQANQRIEEFEQQAQLAESQCADAEQEQAGRKASIDALKAKRAEVHTSVQTQQHLVNDQKVAVARLEQRVDGLRLTLEQMLLDATEREKSVLQAVESLKSLEERSHSSRTSAVAYQQSLGELKERAVAAEKLRIEQIAKIDTQSAILSEANRSCEQFRRLIEKNEDRFTMLGQSIQHLYDQQQQHLDRYRTEHQIILPAQVERPSPVVADSSDEERDLLQVADEAVADAALIEADAELNDLDSADSDESAWALSNGMEIAEDPPEQFSEFQARLMEIGGTDEMTKIKNTLEAEIGSLRTELTSTGSVNMEALAELDAFQERYDRLAGHQQDLLEAKDGLIKTMAKIDEDSRHLFVETLQAIRANFQDLYRRSFGGGYADILLENENDPDSGIEIVATPPGKTTLSNSLLSGGEKALTAVALIMAFFQYRPSPFCILDEVDAPFDEANIGRFVTVLKEFLSTTKFIVVSHSKKTMTAANMIYGVTMQESGVSRQVSVRFEEVNEKGEVITQDRKLAA